MSLPPLKAIRPPASPPARNGRVVERNNPAPLVMLAEPSSPSAEAYHSLSINLRFAGLDKQLQMITVTSPGPGEGKSTTVANLAIAMTDGGRSVIAVDADLRRPNLHLLFGLANDAGLTSAVLAPHAPLPLQDSPHSGLRVLTSGPVPPNPAELLASRQIELVLEALRGEADIIIIDTAPAGALADATLVAARTDGVLLVVCAGRTRRDVARRAKEHLERVNAHLLGVVLTGAEVDKHLYAY